MRSASAMVCARECVIITLSVVVGTSHAKFGDREGTSESLETGLFIIRSRPRPIETLSYIVADLEGHGLEYVVCTDPDDARDSVQGHQIYPAMTERSSFLQHTTDDEMQKLELAFTEHEPPDSPRTVRWRTSVGIDLFGCLESTAKLGPQWIVWVEDDMRLTNQTVPLLRKFVESGEPKYVVEFVGQQPHFVHAAHRCPATSLE